MAARPPRFFGQRAGCVSVSVCSGCAAVVRFGILGMGRLWFQPLLAEREGNRMVGRSFNLKLRDPEYQDP